MAELEKVIKAWECCNPLNRRCFECPYDADCFHDSFDRVAIADMVKLLKEQKNLIDCLVEDQVKKIDEMDELLKKQQPKWIPASEKLPEEYEPVLVWAKRAEYEIMHMEKTLQGDMWLNDHDYYISTENTWWMPLPKEPEGR